MVAHLLGQKQPSQQGEQQQIYFVNLREVRNQKFGTPGPLPYKDFSLVPPGSSQGPVLRLTARGQYSVRVVDPIRFFRNFLPSNVRSYSLADNAATSQLFQEFITSGVPQSGVRCRDERGVDV